MVVKRNSDLEKELGINNESLEKVTKLYEALTEKHFEITEMSKLQEMDLADAQNYLEDMTN